MQRNKTMALTTQLFNKLSSKSFISKTCQVHPSLLPLYICLNCIEQQENALCQQCFKSHTCPNKTKQQLSQWLAKQQYNITKQINTIQRDIDQTIHSLKSIRLTHPLSTHHSTLPIPELNRQILVTISNKLNKIQEIIDKKLIEQAVQKNIKYHIDDYIYKIKTMINGIIGISSIKEISQQCTKLTKSTQQLLKNQQLELQHQSSQLYQHQLLTILTSLIQIIHPNQNPTNNINTINNIQSNQKIVQLQLSNKNKQITYYKNKQMEYITNIENLQKIIKQQHQLRKNKQNQICCIEQQYQKQLSVLIQAQSKLAEKLTKLSKLQEQKSNRQTKIKMLQSKCFEYQNQLADAARSSIGQGQYPQKRYNIQQTANKINQLSQHCQLLIIENKNKDRKIEELMAQIKKQQITKQITIHENTPQKGLIQQNGHQSINQHRSYSDRKQYMK